MICCGVGVSRTSFSFDTLFSYRVPDGLDVRPGMRVVVPFGRGDRRRTGIVLEVCDREDEGQEEQELKSIGAVIDDEPFLNEEQLAMLIRLRDVTMCTYDEAFRVLSPPGFGIELSHAYELRKKPRREQCSDKAYRLYMSASEAENADEAQALIASDKASLRELIDGGFVGERENIRQKILDATITMVRLCPGAENRKLTKKQEKAAEILAREGTASVKELCYLAGCTASVIKNMCSAGVCETYEMPDITAEEVTERASLSDVVLSGDQQRVYDGIAAMIDSRRPCSALLRGVTGSGKTLVFVKLIEHTLAIGRNVILLIPEISLTPQTVKRFTSLFGETVAVMHSGLSLSKRSNEYRRIKEGMCRIVVGTRSAVFSPVDNIGLIVIDEEGERTYKSEKNPRYTAKDIAAFRCARHGCTMLMASATPSIETYYGAVNGRTRLFELDKRFNLTPVRTHIVDVTGLRRNFSDELIYAVRERMAKGEQSIILLNRRGYSTYAKCTSCKTTISCPNCSIGLTYHKVNRLLMCHYCGYTQPVSAVCPVCRQSTVALSGAGTQRLEEEIAEYFPDARILRMDADTTYSRYAYENSFSAFRRGEYDIMVGTQMIAKGLDFPKVTLVGVTGIDKALFTGDFRAYERTFSLITQVVGRSGRGENSGMALIQTTQPDHYIIGLGAAQDYRGFYEQEIKLRRAMIYPPFCDMCVVGISSILDEEARTAAQIFERMLREAHSGTEKMPLIIYRATKCDVEKVCGQFRYKIVLKCRNDRRFRELITAVRLDALKMKEFRDVSLYVDINGDIP